MTRVNMMKNIVTNRRQPHSPLDNVNTPYNPIRLLKGAPPGQEAVNHYISELSIEKNNNKKLADKQRKHLVMLEVTSVNFVDYIGHVVHVGYVDLVDHRPCGHVDHIQHVVQILNSTSITKLISIL